MKQKPVAKKVDLVLSDWTRESKLTYTLERQAQERVRLLLPSQQQFLQGLTILQ